MKIDLLAFKKDISTCYNNVIGLLIRLIIGFILLAHVYQKIFIWGITNTENTFKSLNIPFPIISVYYSTVAELICGIILIFGTDVCILRIVAILFILIDLFGAVLFIHIEHGIFASNMGWEFPISLMMASILSLQYPGKFIIIRKKNK